MTYRMSKAQLATFETFYSDTIAGGSLRFDLPDPVRGATMEVRIVPEYQVTSVGAAHFDVALEIEVLP